MTSNWPSTTKRGQFRRRMAMVLAALYKHGEMSLDEISNSIGVEKDYIQDIMDRLFVEHHSIYKRPIIGHRGHQKRAYSLKPACREWIRKGNLKAWGERYG